MRYDFDRIIDRRGTNCDKFESLEPLFGTDKVIPLWLADMDFAVGNFIVDAMKNRLEHPIFGYTFRPQCYHEAVQGWIGRHGHWRVECDWMKFSPGVVAGVTFAMLGNTRPGDGVLIQPPVYHPFANTIRFNGRTVVNNPLIQRAEGHYDIDFEDLDRKLAASKVMILCNPHNPTGRVFTRDELLRIGELCRKHDVVIVSDEIHSDFAYPPHKHLHIASLTEELASRTVTLVAPSKSFNIAGLSTAVAIIPDEKLRERYAAEAEKIHIDNGNIFGTVACEAAYNHGDLWLADLLEYLQGNIDFVSDFIRREIPSVRCYKPEATFLMWLDFRQWGMDHNTLCRFLITEAGLGLGDGSIYGTEGEGYMRLNIGTQRAVLEKALVQLCDAAQKI